MGSSFRSVWARMTALCAVTAAAGLIVTACGGSADSAGMPEIDHGVANTPAHSDHHSMTGMPTGNGLAADAAGFRFVAATSTLPAGEPATFQFRIAGADGDPITTFEPDQTKLMHFYLVRSDLTGFQHVHPNMGAGGTWSAALAPPQPGIYRAYASFITKDRLGKTVPLVLSRSVVVPGPVTATPLPAPSTLTQVDGYTVTLAGGPVMSGREQALTVAVSKDGRPVTDLQPYLDTYAHLTAFHDGDLAFAHLHPHTTVNGDHGGPSLPFDAMLPQAGNWRLFLQFQTAGVVHTAAVTLPVG